MKNGKGILLSIFAPLITFSQPDASAADKAAVFYAKGELRESLKQYNEAIGSDDQSAKLYYQRGLVYYNLKNDTAAIHDFDRAAKLGVDGWEVFYYRGLCKFFRHQYSGAVADFDQALSRRKYHAGSYIYRGAAKYHLKQDVDAIKDECWAISINPKDPLPYYYCGLARMQVKDYRPAVADFDRAIALKNETDYRLCKARCHYQLREYGKAIPEYSEVIKTESQNAETWYERGICYLLDGDDANAIRDFNKTLDLKPGLTMAYHYRGLAKKFMNDLPGACADLQKAKASGIMIAEAELSKMDCR